MVKVGLISDTHGDLSAWQKLLPFLKDCHFVLHAGDVLYHGVFNPILPSYDPGQLAEELNNSKLRLLLARGNCDSDVDQLALNFPLSSPYLVCQLDYLSILVHHGHLFSPDELLKLAERWSIKMILTGHTHSFVIEERDGVWLVNPGSPSLPKDNKPPSFALLEDRTVRLISLEDGRVLQEATLLK